MRRAIYIIADTVEIYLDKHISRASAALSYFLVLSFFPMLICLHAMLGSVFPAHAKIEGFASGFLPEEVVEIIMDYFVYVTANNSSAMLFAALFSMVISSAAAYRGIHSVIGSISGRPRFEGVVSFAFSFLFSLFFLAAIYFAVIVMLTGRWFVEMLVARIPILKNFESWVWLRFVVLLLILLLICYGLFVISFPKRRHRDLTPGALFSAFAIVAVSALFSVFIGFSAKYPLIYGSLAAVMILMFWLYLCGNILYIGAILNVTIKKHR